MTVIILFMLLVPSQIFLSVDFDISFYYNFNTIELQAIFDNTKKFNKILKCKTEKLIRQEQDSNLRTTRVLDSKLLSEESQNQIERF